MLSCKIEMGGRKPEKGWVCLLLLPAAPLPNRHCPQEVSATVALANLPREIPSHIFAPPETEVTVRANAHFF
jgi:hypothetical protein